MSKTIEQALDEVVADIKAKQKQNARRLAKIHKLNFGFPKYFKTYRKMKS